MISKLYDKTTKIIKENLWFILSIFIIIFLFNFELPYYIESPGGYISINNRIKIDNNDNDIKGDYGLAYVTMIKGTLPFLGYSYLNKDWDIVSKEDIKYTNETIKEMNDREKIYLNEALANAKYVAYNYANEEVKILNKSLHVTYIDNDDTELKLFDIIKGINNQNIDTVEEIRKIINETKEKYVTLDVIRNNEYIKIKSSIYEIEDKKYLGVMITPNYEIETNPKIDISIKNNESGPSGGFMLALGIYSKLTGEDLTKGDKIIGTGTIDMNGNIGEIGGVKYKVIGAYKNNAKLFLCPKENYEEASNIVKERNYDIEVVSVETFEDAIKYLKER